MRPSLKDQLAGIKLDFSTYSKLPIREDVLVFDNSSPDDKEKKAILAQWEKLNYLRTHLDRLNQYIQKNHGESIGDWLARNNIGLSKVVLEKIGSHNNSTGGISAYFFNLQNFYDQEEQKYDEMEAKAKMPSDISNLIGDLRNRRYEKRLERREMRKLKMKDMKADGLGYLQIVVDEPEVVAADEAPQSEIKKSEVAVALAVKKVHGNISIWIAGAIIVVAAMAIYANFESE